MHLLIAIQTEVCFFCKINIWMNLRAVLKKTGSIFFNAKEWLMNPVVLTSSFGAVISSLPV